MLQGLACLVGLVPERLVRVLAAVGGWLWWGLLRYRRRVIAENLAIAFPEQSAGERRVLGRAACRHLVLTLLEFLRMPRYARDGLEHHVRIEGLEHWTAALAKGRGVLCLSGHLGSFELAVAAAARHHPIALVVKPFPPGVDAFMSRHRAGLGLRLIPATNATRAILRALAEGTTVVFVLDQNATRSIGVFVDFFGKAASTMTGLARLALASGAPVIAAVPYREPSGAQVLVIRPEIPLEPRNDREATVQHMTQLYTRVIEGAIRAHPEQWFWTHRRWRTRPKPELPARAP